MRRTLGTAVFAGMLGVTLFGIFLTPVFYYVIQWFKDRHGARPKTRTDANEHSPVAHFISGLGHGLKEIEGRPTGGARISPEQVATLERGLNRIQELLQTGRSNGQGSITKRPLAA